MIFDWCSSCFGWNKLEEEIEELDRPEVKLDSLNMGLGMWLTIFFSITTKVDARDQRIIRSGIRPGRLGPRFSNFSWS